MPEILLNNLDILGIKRLDYIISNHSEPDHSGAIPQVAAKYPEAQLVCTPKLKICSLICSICPRKNSGR